METAREIVFAGMMLGAALMELGYVGQCSFDFIVTDDGVKIVECNGRWGGTSTPMCLVDRVVRTRRPVYCARQFVTPQLIGRDFSALAGCFGDTLYDRRTDRGHFILHGVGGLRVHGILEVIGLGNELDEARAAVEIEAVVCLARS
jgi:hypothetical protein